MERCGWVTADPLYIKYHDEEWGIPRHDDRYLFEMLVLEGAQAGLSWFTVLKRRENYRDCLDGFDVDKIALYDESKLAALMQNEGIIRHRLKIDSLVTNAQAFKKIQNEFGSFSSYLWNYTGGTPIFNRWKSLQEVPARTELSDAISKDLKKRGFKFFGTTICYAFLQATGVVNDHTINCFCHPDHQKD
ncbi:DNA-3-methyladenine glycosylase I [Peribacillus sp. SCS-155]|uniref:DNA-3-methyladenine glycosylase I n=1 Tax=Peribacillus sedimenti TaxID=3115297 RepID=UPI0039057A7F